VLVKHVEFAQQFELLSSNVGKLAYCALNASHSLFGFVWLY
jgi:hypothetical protein